jgi:oligopeptide transport system substrate-binding protein
MNLLKFDPFSFRRLTLLAVIIALMLGSAGCGGQTNAPTAVHYPSSTPRPSTPTIPRPTPTAVPTYTPAPSPTPPGYINMYAAGYSLTVPISWQATAPAENVLFMISPNEPLVIGIFSYAEKKATPFDQVLTKIKAQLSSYVSFSHKADGDIHLADGVLADYTDFTVRTEAGKQELRVIYTHVGGFTYALTIQTNVGGLDNRKMLIDSILQSLHLFTPQASDLPHEQTLAMVGDEPNPGDLDPAITLSSNADYVGLLFSGLVRMSPDLKIVPALAESWKISDDGLVYTFTLPQLLKFADGKSITAQDVKDSWERACDPKTSSTTARTYLGDIVGAIDRLDGKAAGISGVKVVDDSTLEVTIDDPKPYFLAKLTSPTAAVVDVKSIKNSDWVWTPNASGPYSLKSHEKDYELVFERNPNYPHKAAIPYAVFLGASGSSALNLYQMGALDLLPLSSDQVTEISKPSNAQHADMVSGVSMCTIMLQYKTGNAPTDDAAVRKALSLAIDRTALRTRLGDEKIPIAKGVLPPAMPGYQKDRQAMAYDLQAAKDALGASSYASKLPTVKLVVAGSADTASQNPLLLSLVDSWEKNLGIQVDMEYVDPVSAVASERASKGNVVVFTWCADYADPQNYLDILYHSASDYNVGEVADTELDALVEQARIEADSQKRLELYQQAETRIMDEIYTYPLFNPQVNMLVKPRVKGFVLSPVNAAIVPWLSLSGG